MTLKRLPSPVLRPFVALIWASDAPSAKPFAPPVREHLLPSGGMHIVFRTSDGPLRIFGPDEIARAQPVGAALVGGARSRYYVRELSAPSSSVGAVLRPGAAQLLLGASADELAERHTLLEDLWGASARSVREQLLEARRSEDRLAILEATLAARLPRVHAMHPAIASVLEAMHRLPSVESLVRQGGLSHRSFIAHFRRAVGLAPKTYLRVLRFQHALRLLRRGNPMSLAAVAADAGYSDQSHFHREFVELAGATPMAYLRRAPAEANHLPLGAGPGRVA